MNKIFCNEYMNNIYRFNFCNILKYIKNFIPEHSNGLNLNYHLAMSNS